MKRILVRFVLPAALLAAATATLTPRISGQSTGQPSTKNGEWPMYTADLRGSKYSPLDQVNATNFSKMEVAWRFKTDNLGPRPESWRGAQRVARSPSSRLYIHFNSPDFPSRATTARRVPAVA